MNSLKSPKKVFLLGAQSSRFFCEKALIHSLSHGCVHRVLHAAVILTVKNQVITTLDGVRKVNRSRLQCTAHAPVCRCRRGDAARLVNKVRTHCMIYGAQNGSRIIDDHMVKRVIQGELS